MAEVVETAQPQAAKYAITGIQEPSHGFVPVRREISSWWDVEDAKDLKDLKGVKDVRELQLQKSLFVQALNKLQEISPRERISYFQLAGIHGFPVVSWDGEDAGTNNPFGGYCTHNMITFPLWHRPYLALFEQALHEIMIEKIVSKIQDPASRKEWKAAADTLRLPYWDWSKTPKIPKACDEKTVMIVMPDNSIKKENNPLERYRNINSSGDPVPMGDSTMEHRKILDHKPHSKPYTLPWPHCLETSRHGIKLVNGKWVLGENNNDQASKALENKRYQKDPGDDRDGASLKNVVGRMLTNDYLKDYLHFASTKYHPKNEKEEYTGKNFLSLEEVHDQVHGWTGGENPELGVGHMGDIPVAAFDPIFWLHHCNIDRLFAVWQKLNPTSGYTRYDGPSIDPDPEFNAPLPPFHFGPNPEDHQTGENNWSYSKYNYDYDTLDYFKDKSDEEFINYIKETYPTASTTVDKTKLKISYAPVTTNATDNKSTRVYDDYVINVIYDRYALEGLAYSIIFFLEDVSPLSDYQKHSAYLGKVYTASVPIGQNGEATCANCARQKKAKVKSTAHIPITTPLIHYIEEKKLDIEDWGTRDPWISLDSPWNQTNIEQILKERLTVKFVDLAGRVYDPTEFPNTTYAVIRGTGQIREGSGRFPTFNNYRVLRGVTDNQPLGWADGQDFRIQESNDLDQFIQDDEQPITPSVLGRNA